MRLDQAIDLSIERSKAVRALQKREGYMGRNISEQLAALLPTLIADLQKIVADETLPVTERIAAANTIAHIHSRTALHEMSTKKTTMRTKVAQAKAEATALRKKQIDRK